MYFWEEQHDWKHFLHLSDFFYVLKKILFCKNMMWKQSTARRVITILSKSLTPLVFFHVKTVKKQYVLTLYFLFSAEKTTSQLKPISRNISEVEEEQQESCWKKTFTINKTLLPLKMTLFFFSASAFSILPYLTIHMKDIGITVS